MFTKSVSADRGLVGQPRMFGARGDWTSRRTLGGLAQASAVSQAVNALTSAGRKGVIPGSATGRFWWRDRNRTQPWDPAVDLEKTIEFADDLTGNPVGWQLGADLLGGAGSFNSATGWTVPAGWSISGGVATKTAGNTANLSYTLAGLVDGRQYQVTATGVNLSASGLDVRIGGAVSVASAAITNGTWSAIVTKAVGSNNTFDIRSSVSAAGSIGNITVQEVIRDESWLGPELATNGDFSTDTLWTKDAGVSISGGACVFSGVTTNRGVYRSSLVTPGRVYVVTYSITVNSGSVRALVSGSFGASRTVSGTYSEPISGTSGNLFGIFANPSFDGSIDNVSVREIPGHPIVSAVSGSGLVGSKRVNLLQRTEDLTHSVWTKQNITLSAATDPAGGTKAFRVEATTTGFTTLTQNITGAGNTSPGSFKARILCKKGSSATDGNVFIVRDQTAAQNMVTATLNYDTGSIVIGTGSGVPGVTATATPIGSGWYEVVLTCAAVGNGNLLIFYAGFAGSSYSAGAHCFLAFPDCRYAFWNSFNLPPYQRVGDGTAGVFDYDDTAGPLHLKNVTGTQAMMTLGTVDMSAGDAGVLLANVVKLSDAAVANIAELSASGSTAGMMSVFSSTSTSGNYGARHRGTLDTTVVTAAGSYPSPHVAALIARGDISADQCGITVNGVAATPATTDQGTGNLGNHRLNIAGRDVGGTASLRFTGYYIGNLPALVAGDAGIDTLALSRELAAQGSYTY